jgi:hypothetical protein
MVRSEWVSALLDKRAPIRAAVVQMVPGLAPAFYNVSTPLFSFFREITCIFYLFFYIIVINTTSV